jgi:hypothetical protein
VAARGEKVEEALSDVVTCHFFIVAKAGRAISRWPRRFPAA